MMRTCHFGSMLIALAVFIGSGPPVFSQETLPTRSTSIRKSSELADHREQLFREIATDVTALQQQGSLLKKVVQVTKPTVVHLESVKLDDEFTYHVGSDTQPTVEEAGSGVVIELDEKFFVVTNRHVIQDAAINDISIRSHDGRMLTPMRVWANADTDVAVIRITEQDGLIGARIGNSDLVDIGEFVLAVGSPFGLSHSVSFGIVSAKGRRDLELGNQDVRLQDFLQTDAAINPGNSGGPLLNLRGEVVAINTAIASASGGNEGVSFSIPINLVMFVARQLVASGEVEHAYLGVQLDKEFDILAAKRHGLAVLQGTLVLGITPRSPAYFAKLKAGDLIVRFNTDAVEDDDHLVNLVSVTPIGSTVPIEIIRDNKRLRVNVTVGNRKHFEAALQP